MEIITSCYGEKYVPFLQVFLKSTYSSITDAKVTVYWADIPHYEIELLKKYFVKTKFIHKPGLIQEKNMHKRIPLKLRMWIEGLKNATEQNICLIDSDTIILKDISTFFKEKFDVGYTYKDDKWPINVGVILIKKSNKTILFLEDWLTKTEEIVKNEELLNTAIINNGAADQEAFAQIVNYNPKKENTYTYNNLVYKPISCELLNQTNSVFPNETSSFILHYKGGWHPIFLERKKFNLNRPESTSWAQKDLIENIYHKTSNEILKNYILFVSKKYLEKKEWKLLENKERGILKSEMLSVISLVNELKIDVLIESGRALGASTEILGCFFNKSPVKVYSVERYKLPLYMKSDKKILQKYKNLKLLYGNSKNIIPKILEKYKDKKIAILYDGPKGTEAYSQFTKLYEKYDNLALAFFHDVGKSSKLIPSTSRTEIENKFERVFCTDDQGYVNQFAQLDQNYKPTMITKDTWRPYHKGYLTTKSYGPTLGVVLLTSRDRYNQQDLVYSLKNNILIKKIARKITYRI